MEIFDVEKMEGENLKIGEIIGGVMIVIFKEIMRRINIKKDIGKVFLELGEVKEMQSGEKIEEKWKRIEGKMLKRRKRKER